MIIPDTVSGRKVTPRGVHLHPNGLHDFWVPKAGYWTKLLADMGISWALTLTESDNILISGAAEALLSAGVIPIYRYAYKLPSPWTHGDVTRKLVALNAQYGAPALFQFCNEPFDPREWKNGNVPPYEEAWSIIVQRWHEMVDITVAEGGYPGFPDGPCYADNPFLRIGDDKGYWAEGTCWYSGHHYGKGRPWLFPGDDVSARGTPMTAEEYQKALGIFWMHKHYMDVWVEGDPELTVEKSLEFINRQRAEWPPVEGLTPLDDDTCVRGYEKVQWWAQEAFQHDVLMVMGEGGWVPNDRAGSNPVDCRWARTVPDEVAKKTLELYELSGPSFIAICPWLLADALMAGGSVGWEDAAWVSTAWTEFYPDSFEMPVVKMLKDNPPVPYDLRDEIIENLAGTVYKLTDALYLLEEL